MRIGVGIGGRTLDDAVEQAKRAKESGFTTLGVSNIFGQDAMTVCSVVGREVEGVELVTAVVPTYPRHPFAMAQQALSTHDACGGRFILGIGLSHQIVIETMLGMSFEKPARHMREYLAVLLPLLREGRVSHKGDVYNVSATLERVRDDSPSVVIAAMAPVMLKLAGSVADGTSLWMTGPNTIKTHVAPRINEAAEQAGRPQPRIAAALPVCVTDDVAKAREAGAKAFAVYGTLPSYRAMLDKEGADTPGDVAIVGSEDQVAEGIQKMADAGVTDFSAAFFGSPDEVSRSRELVSRIVRSG